MSQQVVEQCQVNPRVPLYHPGPHATCLRGVTVTEHAGRCLALWRLLSDLIRKEKEVTSDWMNDFTSKEVRSLNVNIDVKCDGW